MILCIITVIYHSTVLASSLANLYVLICRFYNVLPKKILYSCSLGPNCVKICFYKTISTSLNCNSSVALRLFK